MKLETWKRIFDALSDDIADRRGLKWEWNDIDPEVLTEEEISPAWRKIIEGELDRSGVTEAIDL